MRSRASMAADEEPFRERTRSYYAARLAAHGATAHGMDWKDEASQRLRFERIARHLAPGASLLDVGCGDASLLAFLRASGAAPSSYLGIDIVPGMVDAARARHGEAAARVASLAELDPSRERFDYVVAS